MTDAVFSDAGVAGASGEQTGLSQSHSPPLSLPLDTVLHSILMHRVTFAFTPALYSPPLHPHAPTHHGYKILPPIFMLRGQTGVRFLSAFEDNLSLPFTAMKPYKVSRPLPDEPTQRVNLMSNI